MKVLTDKELVALEATRDLNTELLEGVKQMLSGKAAKTSVITETDVALARKKAHLTQEEFAHILGISKRTLEAWEQGNRHPSGAAKSLIKLFIKDPVFVKESLA